MAEPALTDPGLAPALVAAVIYVALLVYTLTGGADFGGGVWDLFAAGPRRDRQLALVARAIGPIWEANHVWLIVVVVLLFVCFPPAFAAIMTALHIPLTLMLIGVVLRGSAFVFRAYDPVSRGAAGGDTAWGRVFAVSSLLTPVTLGLSLGAVVGGGLRLDPATGLVQTDFVSAWLAPFPLLVGLATLSISALLAAVYLVHEAGPDAELRADFRRRALLAGVATGASALGALAAARTGAPALWDGLMQRPWSPLFQAGTALIAVGALVAILTRRDQAARLLVGAQVVAVVGGLGAATWPWILPGQLRFVDAASPPEVLWPVLGVLLGGAVPTVPAFLWLYAVFKGPPAAADAAP
jgi:cytochrome d ubiquinol oxidase subunit II